MQSILASSEYFYQISSKLIHIISSYTVSNLGRFVRHSVDIIRIEISYKYYRCYWTDSVFFLNIILFTLNSCR